MVDLTDEVKPGDTDVLLFTMNLPNGATSTRIIVDDDNGDVVIDWP